MSHQTNKILKNNYIVLAFFVFIFFGPIVMAHVLFKNAGYWNLKTMNAGQLIQPVVSLSKFNLRYLDGKIFNPSTLKGKWWLLYVNTKECDHTCEMNLHMMHQVWVALGKDQDRVGRLYFSSMESR